MPLDRTKFKHIVGGITTPVPPTAPPVLPAVEPGPPAAPPPEPQAGQGGGLPGPAPGREPPAPAPSKRFAKTGRPRGQAADKSTKVKVSLYIDKTLTEELYDWAHQDRVQPGVLFERALRDFRNREAKRRNSGTE